MDDYIKKFETVEEYNEFKESDLYLLPHTSYCNETHGVSYGPIFPMVISDTRFKSDEDGGNKTIEVTSPMKAWTAITSDEWITVSPSEGASGTSNVTVSITASQLDREGYVEFTDGYTTQTLNILQENIPFEDRYLTLKVTSDGAIRWKHFPNASTSAKTISYSTDMGESWTTITSTSGGTTFNVNAGDKVMLRGYNESYAISKTGYTGFDSSGLSNAASYEIQGNIMSLISGDYFKESSVLSGTYNFCSIFKLSSATSAKNLILPTTTLTSYCYRAMFSKAHSMAEAPALPATTLAVGCYWYMFEECPITKAPDLNVLTVSKEAYGGMFLGCTELNYIKCMATNITATSAVTSWVSGVTTGSTGVFVKNSSMSSWTRGKDGIPSGWTVFDDEALMEPEITCDGELITISCVTPNADIYYRLNESGEYSAYTSPIEILQTTTAEAYATKNGLTSETTTNVCVYHRHIKKYDGIEFAPGPLSYGNDGYEISTSWSATSYNTSYGKTVGSTYFSYIEAGQLFEDQNFSTSSGDILNELDPLDGWRLPTQGEWYSIVGTSRNGSTVNGNSGVHYAFIQLTGVTYAGSQTPNGMLLFPDDETITGITLDGTDGSTITTGITAEQLQAYLSQGCVFLPLSSKYEGSWGQTDSATYLSATEYDTTYCNVLTVGTDSRTIANNADKANCYGMVWLVKDATYDGETPLNAATRSLRTWNRNGDTVTVPYSVNAIDGHSSAYTKGNYSFETNVSFYEAQPTYLWFQHADQSADIYVDNTKVTTHWGGYNAFFTDITNYVHAGDNAIKVTLCNQTRTTLAPCDGDFNFNATLGYVKVISSPVLPDASYGYDGFHITSEVSADTAIVTVKTSVPSGGEVILRIDDEDENYHYVDKKISDGNELVFTTTISNPRLWNGKIDPHLYNFTLEVYHNGDLFHKYERPYGFRYYEYVINDTNVLPSHEAYTGFLLNGSPYLLRGVCMHSDIVGKANALTVTDIENDFEIIDELGCNFIRLAHYPHPKEVYDICDRKGIIVQTEVPCVNKFQSSLPEDYYTHLTDQYADMVNQHYNHPCIMFWGLSNEATTNDTTFAKEKVEQYTTQIHNLDLERWVGYVVSHGSNNPSAVFGNPDVDWFGCNIYVGWYIDKTSNNPSTQINTRINNTISTLGKPLAFSEYGAGGTRHCHSDNFKETTTTGNYERHDIEYQMWLHEGHIAAIRNYPQLLFTSQWQLFDIAVSKRNEGYTVCLDGENAYTDENLKHLNNKGLVERDHTTKKDTFYIYKAEWSDEKFVHICGKDYTKKADRTIKCYTNDGRLTLYVNGVEKESASPIDNIVNFTSATYNSGDVVRVAGTTSEDTFTF